MRAFLTLSLLAAAIAAQAEIEVLFSRADAARGRVDARLPCVPETPQNAATSGDAYTYALLPDASRAADESADWLHHWLRAADAPDETPLQNLDLFLFPALNVPDVSCLLMRRSNWGTAEAEHWDRRIPTRFVVGPGRVLTPGVSGISERVLASAPRASTDAEPFQVLGARATSGGLAPPGARFLSGNAVFIIVPVATLVLLLGGVTLRSGRRQAEPS